MNIRIFSLILVLFVIYVLSINIIAFIYKSPIIEKIFIKSKKIGQNVGFADSVAVTVLRKKWYGRIYENVGDLTTSDLYLFRFIKIPLKTRDIDFRKTHNTFLVLSTILVLSLELYIFLNNKRRYEYDKLDNKNFNNYVA